MKQTHKKLIFNQIIADSQYQKHEKSGLIGYGHSWDLDRTFPDGTPMPRVITRDEAEWVLWHDIPVTFFWLLNLWPRVEELSAARRCAVINLGLLCGVRALMEMDGLRASINARDWLCAAKFILNRCRAPGEPAGGPRVERIAEQLLTGRFQ